MLSSWLKQYGIAVQVCWQKLLFTAAVTAHLHSSYILGADPLAASVPDATQATQASKAFLPDSLLENLSALMSFVADSASVKLGCIGIVILRKILAYDSTVQGVVHSPDEWCE